MAGRKSSGVHPVVWGFVGLVLFGILVDLVKDESESLLKRNGWWPRA